MAILTLVAAAAVVDVIIAVTTDTCCWRKPESLVFVTVCALNFLVFSKQLIVSCLVIEFNFQPICLVVTVGTGGADETFVYVVILMAGIAV